MSRDSSFDLTPIKFKIPGQEVVIDIVLLPQWKKDNNDKWVEQAPVPYMKVPQRLVWFNLEKSNWRIETNVVEVKEGYVQANCVIKDPEGNVMRTAHKTLKYQGEKDWDAAETGAIGRALAMLGYGTQYASNELEEADEDPVDAPTSTLGGGKVTEKKESKVTFNPPLKEAFVTEDDPFWKPKTESVKKNSLPMKGSSQTSPGQNTAMSSKTSAGDYIVKITNENHLKGKRIKEIPQDKLMYWMGVIESNVKKSSWDREFLENAHAHLKEWNKNPLNPKIDYEEPLPF